MNDIIQNKYAILAVIASLGSMAANQLGGWDAALKLLVCMMAADYVMGLLIAAFWKKSTKSASGALSSEAGFKGLCKKAVILLAVWIGTLLDAATGATYIRTAVVLFYIGNEGISVVENLGIMGVPFPPAMKQALDALKDQGSEKK